MMRTRCITVNSTCACLLVASMVAGQENDAPEKPQRFRSLFEVKQAVSLRTSTTSPLFTIQLLSDEQTGRLEELDAEQAETEQRMSSIEDLIEGEQSLERLAVLFKERQGIQNRLSRLVNSQRRIGIRFVVTHVGEDYVALSSDETERFVPFRMIRYLHRSENLEAAGPFLFGHGRLSRGDPLVPRTGYINLRNADATELVEVIKNLYSDTDLKIIVDSDGNTLKLESREADLKPIKQLIESLVEEVGANTHAEDGRDQ